MSGKKSADIGSDGELLAACAGHAGLTVVLLWAPWHPPSAHLTTVFDALAPQQPALRFLKVNTDVAPKVAERLGAQQVPFVVFLSPSGATVDSLAGADPPKLVEKVKLLASRPVPAASTEGASTSAAASGDAGQGADLNARLKELISFSPVMLFMKGTKHDPFCKFSKQCVAILNKTEVEYSTFDIMQDEDVRQGLKDYSNWKTYPQLYVGGALIGGVDIIKEMDEEGSLADIFPSGEDAEMVSKPEPLEQRLRALVSKAPVMLFMKGTPDGPFCGFSAKIVEILREESIKFESFDILSDEAVRQGLKTFSNWPTFPQLYANGTLVGGIDIVKELHEEGSLQDELSNSVK